jgi:pimeloyl-ACP methyl ester carboxylesterase
MSIQQEVKERGRRTVGEHARERLLSGLPVTERRLHLAGVSTAVLEGGDGPPIVLLQGEFAAVWMRVIPELVTSHRVIAPDLPGLGASEVSDSPPDASITLTWLGELIKQTCAIPPVLVGKGPGGALAARFAIDHSDRIDRLVLWGRDDVGVRLNVAEAASVRYGWPLHVIENARDDPAIEQPEAFLEALDAALDDCS